MSHKIKTTIGIDCRLSGSSHAGIGRYIEELVLELVKDQTINWVLFFFEENQIPTLPKADNITTIIAPIRHYSVAEQLYMPGFFANAHLDLLHVPHYNVPILYRGKLVITIHDLLWHYQNNASATTLSPITHFLKYQAYRFVVSKAIATAQTIFVPAKTIKQSIGELYPDTSNGKIVVTYEGISTNWKQGEREKGKGLSNKKKILFYTGSLYPHKNVMLVVQALKDLPDYELYISSSRTIFVDQFMQEVEKLGLGDRVHHLGRLSDKDVLSWYEKSFALVQPSLSEGFGLTGIEAMAAGLPLLASDIPIFKEIYQDAFIPFDPQSTKSFITAVHTLEKENRTTLMATGTKVASTYSWKRMAEETLREYKKVL